MAQQTMYPAIANSPGTELSAALTVAATTIAVVDATKLPAAPNVFTIGSDESSETVLYTGKSGNTLTGCTRGFDGTTSKAWAIGSKVARYYTAYDHEAFRKNLTDLSGVTSESTTDIVLSAGQQILNATKNARLQGLKVQGRTLIDLLSGAGSGESLVGWSQSPGVPVTTSSTQKRSGSSSFKAAPGATGASYLYRDYSIPLDKSQQYVLVAWVYIESVSASNVPEISLRDIGTFTSRYPAYAASSKVGEWQLLVVKIPTANTLSTAGFRLLVGCGSTGAGVSYFDELRLYAVSATDYAAIGNTITGDAVDRLLPYVPPGISGVDGLWVRRYGKNLLPSVPDTLNANAKMNGPYDFTLTATAAYQYSSWQVPAVGGQSYTLRLGETAGLFATIAYFDANGTLINFFQGPSATVNTTFITPDKTSYMRIDLGNSVAGTFTFKNWQLELGNTATTFQPREDSLIAFSGVELHANPNDGTEPDVLREVNGRYEVTRLWRKMALDGALTWYYSSSSIGFKQVIVHKIASAKPSQAFITRFDGKSLKYTASASADNFDFGSSAGDTGSLYMSVPSADSGWGDSYTPSQAEMQAYFYGWKMYDVNVDPSGGGVYNRTDGVGKWWCPIDRSANGVPVLPTTKVTSVASYQLLYRLAAPDPITIQPEGAISLLEGDNFVEVGTGYVSRGRANPVGYGGVWYINSAFPGFEQTRLKNKVQSILAVYKNGLLDQSWVIDTLDGYGVVRVKTAHQQFDPSASYSVSYIKLDKSPVPSVTGAYAATEKAQIHDLTDGVTEALARLSVVEAKKADKDAPAWITPTLLNGWVAYKGAYPTATFYKDASGIVHLNGLVMSGVISPGTPLFTLPTGYRPVGSILVATVCSDGATALQAALAINSDGTVAIFRAGGNNMLSFGNITFLAEQ